MAGQVPAEKHSPGSRLGLDGARRLRRSAEFVKLLREGQRRSWGGYTFFFERGVEGPPRLGILVSRKHSARATDRNYIKRCVREAFRLEQERLGSIDVLVRPPYSVIPGAEMIVRLREMLVRVAA